MADKVNKSKPFEVGNGTYVTTVTNGEISSISVVDSNNNYKPVIPGTDIFDEAASNQSSLDTLSINRTGTTGNVSEAILQNKEQLNKNYTRLKKAYDNGEFISAVAETPTIITENATVKTETRAETLRYPYDIDKNQDHLKITQFEYQRPFGDFVRGVQASRPAGYDSSGNQTSSADSVRGKPFGKYTGGVLLPMPKVSDSNGAEWGKSDLNVFGLGFTSMAGGFLSAASGKDNTAFEDLRKSLEGESTLDSDDASQGNLLRQNILGSDFAKTGIGNLQGVGMAGLGIGAQELSKFAGVNLSADEVLARTTGKILNPNAELLFQGPVLRDFGFKFLMIARREDEAEETRKIIRFFKIGAAPVYSDGPALLGTPNVFQLEYKAGNRNLDTVNKFNEMALRTITVDYAPDGFWSAYQDSHPVAVVMSLQFSELRPLYRVDHEYGGEVGY